MKRIAIFGLSLLAACGAEFDPGSRVTDFRLLAVGADAPYAAPGETVHLTALAHEPAGRPISYAWLTCENPADTSALGCVAEASPSSLQTGVGLDQIDVTIPSDALDSIPVESRENALVGVVTVACPGTLTAVSGDTLPFRCEEDGTGQVLPYERWAISVKRIFVRTSDRNDNPVIEQLLWDGAPWPDTEVKQVKPCGNNPNHIDDCDGGERHRLNVKLAPGTAEAGTDEVGHEFQEQVVVQYYATEGTFEFDVRTAQSPENEWAARKRASGATQTLWFIVRDNRGGVSWTSRQVDVL